MQENTQQVKISDLNLTLTPIDTKKKKKAKHTLTEEEECRISFKQICERSKKRGYKSVEDAENDLKSAIKEIEDLRLTLITAPETTTNNK